MNLFYQPSVTELRQLINSANKSFTRHNIVIDFDGEVIIDPETKYKGIDLNRFKFRTTITESVKSNARSLKALFDTLLEAYHKNNNGFELHSRFNTAA